jgi:hypothetical protein
MKFIFKTFWEHPTKGLEPLLLPLTLDFPSLERARSSFDKVVRHPNIPVHSVTLESEDGSVSERWFQIDGKWMRKKA